MSHKAKPRNDADPFANGPRFEGLCPRTGKRRFTSKAKAKREIKRARKSGKTQLVYAYPCKHCGDFHTTSTPRRPSWMDNPIDLPS